VTDPETATVPPSLPSIAAETLTTKSPGLPVKSGQVRPTVVTWKGRKLFAGLTTLPRVKVPTTPVAVAAIDLPPAGGLWPAGAGQGEVLGRAGGVHVVTQTGARRGQPRQAEDRRAGPSDGAAGRDGAGDARAQEGERLGRAGQRHAEGAAAEAHTRRRRGDADARGRPPLGEAERPGDRLAAGRELPLDGRGGRRPVGRAEERRDAGDVRGAAAVELDRLAAGELQLHARGVRQHPARQPARRRDARLELLDTERADAAAAVAAVGAA